MKRIILLVAAVMGCCGSAGAQWFRQPTPNDTLQSVKVLPDGRVLFQIYAPNAQNIMVTGDLPWDKPVKFAKQENGVWQGIREGLADGCFRYSFLVDGVKVQDPKTPLSAEQASVFTKGDGYIKDVPHGAVSQRWYYSETLGQLRRMHVWTPAGYEKSADALPVLYLIHGGGDNDASWPGVGAAGWILDNLLSEGKMVPMIVVMPNGSIPGPDMMSEVPLFGEDMVRSIIPFVEANYRVIADKNHRAMAGLSMGGMETIETAFKHPELFNYVWVLSSSFSPGKQKEYIEQIKLNEIAPKLNFKALYFTQGGPSDIAYRNCQEALGYLKAAGIKYQYLENAQAGHSWITWRADLQTLAPTLFK
ncbi:MAG: endo-1,4-beta-xylanase Z [Bacteroidales bacterium]|nr:endo-1,4-beta-xylanase Z [Bacteroidales bacterium]